MLGHGPNGGWCGCGRAAGSGQRAQSAPSVAGPRRPQRSGVSHVSRPGAAAPQGGGHPRSGGEGGGAKGADHKGMPSRLPGRHVARFFLCLLPAPPPPYPPLLHPPHLTPGHQGGHAAPARLGAGGHRGARAARGGGLGCGPSQRLCACPPPCHARAPGFSSRSSVHSPTIPCPPCAAPAGIGHARHLLQRMHEGTAPRFDFIEVRPGWVGNRVRWLAVWKR